MPCSHRYGLPSVTYLLLIIAKKHYMLNPNLHYISNSIGQVLFKRGDIKNIFNQIDFSTNVPESDVLSSKLPKLAY